MYLSPLAIISAIAGFFISGYAGTSWFSASLVVAACLVVWGTWSFNDDADGLAENASSRGDAELADELTKDKRRNESINTWIIATLISLAFIYEFFI